MSKYSLDELNESGLTKIKDSGSHKKKKKLEDDPLALPICRGYARLGLRALANDVGRGDSA